jgi:hypothetical protein
MLVLVSYLEGSDCPPDVGSYYITVPRVGRVVGKASSQPDLS